MVELGGDGLAGERELLRREAAGALFPVYPGELTLLVGHPGLGKSLVAMDLVGRACAGAMPPRGKAAGMGNGAALFRKPGSAIVLSTENNYLKLQMHAFGARWGASGVPVCQGMTFRPDVDHANVEDEYAKTPFVNWLEQDADEDLRMIVLDPLSAYVGPIGASSSTIMMQLRPLMRYAAAKGIAVVGVLHLTKRFGHDEPVQRALGSAGYTGVARSVLLVTRDERPGKGRGRMLVPLKDNMAPIVAGYGFSFGARAGLEVPVRPAEVPEGWELEVLDENQERKERVKLLEMKEEEKREHARVTLLKREYGRARRAYAMWEREESAPLPPEVVWEEELVLEHPMLQNGMKVRGGDAEARRRAEERAALEKTRLELAVEFYQDALKDGPLASAEVEKLAKAVPLSKSTLERARPWAGVAVRKRGKGWVQEMEGG